MSDQGAGGGVDFSIEAAGSPEVLRQAVDCTGPAGVCAVIGAPAFGTEVSLDMNTILTGGRTVRGIVGETAFPESSFLASSISGGQGSFQSTGS